MSNESPISYLKLKSADATKLGRNGGAVSYLVLTDADRQELYIAVIGNSGGGCWSTECVPLAAIESCLPADRNLPFPAKSLMTAFVGRSSNNPSFLTAVLRTERLLLGAEGKPNQHQAAADWSAWKARMLAMSGEPYAPPVKASMSKTTTAAIVQDSMTRRDMPDDAEAEDAQAGRKGHKGRLPKRAEGRADATLGQ